jgi:hypothetical protein
MRFLTTFSGAAPAALLCLALTSCGNGYTRVTGRLVDGGAAYTLSAGEGMQIDVNTADKAYPPLALINSVKKDGTFVLDMNDGTEGGLPPGKYKMALNREQTVLKKNVNAKLFKEGYTFDFLPGTSTHLVIDIGAGTITPQ